MQLQTIKGTNLKFTIENLEFPNWEHHQSSSKFVENSANSDST